VHPFILRTCEQAKAFDKRTSVLHYFVKLLKRNDESLLEVHKDLQNVKAAELVILDSLSVDIQALKDEILPVLETVTRQADELEASGELIPMTLKELSEQRTSVRAISQVPQYNKVEHHTGRTPMERFTLYAESRIDHALGYSQSVKDKFLNLLDYFGEDRNKASNEFFGILNKFLAEFKLAMEQVEKEEKDKVRFLLIVVVDPDSSVRFRNERKISLRKPLRKRRPLQRQAKKLKAESQTSLKGVVRALLHWLPLLLRRKLARKKACLF
jgi:Formin Homology 2 Domain